MRRLFYAVLETVLGLCVVLFLVYSFVAVNAPWRFEVEYRGKALVCEVVLVELAGKCRSLEVEP